MKCQKCGTELENDVLFCKDCGTKVEKVIAFCRDCGSPINPGVKFCSNCGGKVNPKNDDIEPKRKDENSSLDNNPNSQVIIGTLPKNDVPCQTNDSQTDNSTKRKLGNKKFKMFLIIFGILCALISFINFKNGRPLVGLISATQVISLICSWLMKKNIIKIKKPFISTLLIVLSFVLIVPFFKVATGNKNDNNTELSTSSKDILYWPDNSISKQIPVPDSKYGKVIIENENSIWINVQDYTKEQYEAYIENCKKNGFILEYDKFDTMYSAYNSEGYYLLLTYEDSESTMSIQLDKNTKSDTVTTSITEPNVTEQESTTVINSITSTNAVSTFESTVEITTVSITSESIETTVSKITEVTMPQEPESEYEKAIVRKMSNYYIYYMFDTDSNRFINFTTDDSGTMGGSFSGDFSNSITAYWDEGFNETIKFSGSKAILIDSSGFDWDYQICDISTAQKALDNLK